MNLYKINRITRSLRNRQPHIVDDCLNYLHPRTISSIFGYERKIKYDVVFINLDGSQNRCKSMENQFRKFNIPAHRFSAISFKNEDELHSKYPHIARRPRCRKIKYHPKCVNYIACYLSHLTIIEGLPEDDGLTLVCEDDLVIRGQGFFRWIDAFLNIDFDLLFLDCKGRYIKSDRVKRNFYEISEADPFYWGAHAYLIKHERKNKILSYLEKSEIGSPDNLLQGTSKELKVFCLRTSLSNAIGTFPSDIRN